MFIEEERTAIWFLSGTEKYGRYFALSRKTTIWMICCLYTLSADLPLIDSEEAESLSPLETRVSSLSLNETSMRFRPIKENEDSSNQTSMSPRLIERLSSSNNKENTTNGDSRDSPSRFAKCTSPASKVPRPNSVGSDNSKNTSEKSRPGSASSELCSSSSTLMGSRPESVNSDRIRPSSVSSEGQLHYAHLDLGPPTEDEGSRSPRIGKTSSSDTNTQTQCEPTFSYAEIDFARSEGLKHNTLSNNAKVKH